MNAICRAGLTIGQTGQMPGASRFWGPGAWISKSPLMVFHVFKLFTTRQNCRAFWLLRLEYTLRKLTTFAFKVLSDSDLKSIEQNSTTLYDPRSEISASMGVHRIFSRVGQHRNFAYPFQVADDAMQMHVHKTLSTPLVCVDWTSILNLLSGMFFTLRLLETLFLFINTLISIK